MFFEITKGDLILAGILLLLVVLLLLRKRSWYIKKMPVSEDMPGYQLIYADQPQEGHGGADFGKLLYSAEHALQGKPDYIFRQRLKKDLVPVELKSGRIGEELVPHLGDLMQLGAYFLIIEDVYKKRPAYGKIIYNDFMFLVRNTKGLQRDVLNTTKEMREMLSHGIAKANNSFANCRYCICNGTVCPHSETEIFDGEEESTAPEE